MTNIRDVAATDPRSLGLRHWHNDPQHPGFAYCFCTTGTQRHNFRVHIARKSDFKVLGSFPSFTTANATMLKLYLLEAAAA